MEIFFILLSFSLIIWLIVSIAMPTKKSKVGQHHNLTIGQAFYLLCLKNDIFGPTPAQHNALSRWMSHANSGTVKLPRMGFEDWQEYQTALVLCQSENREKARKANIYLDFTKFDVEIIWRDGYDKYAD